MNKAFVKEQEVLEDRCPLCNTTGRPVSREALEHHVETSTLGRVAQPALFCSNPKCESVYFDQFGRTIPLELVRRPIYPMDPDAPICACFGLTRDDVELDVAEGVVSRCRELVAKSKTADARCSVLAADGHCCVPEMQRYYMKLRQSLSPEADR
jgi:hypothetical protein